MRQSMRLIVACLAVGLFAPASEAAVDMFLRLDGVQGEAKADGHKDEIEVASFAFGAQQPSSQNAGGAARSAGKVNISDVVITKQLDKSSPQLFELCASGKSIKNAVIAFHKAGGDKSKTPFLKYTLNDVRVASVSHTSQAAEDRPVENVALNFAKIEIEYTPVDASGKAGQTVKTGWDTQKNTKADSGASSSSDTATASSGDPGSSASSPPAEGSTASSSSPPADSGGTAQSPPAGETPTADGAPERIRRTPREVPTDSAPARRLPIPRR